MISAVSACLGLGAYMPRRTRRPPIIGAELLSNGNFAADATWTKGGGWLIGSGSANITGNSGTLSQPVVVVAGRQYEVTFTITSFAAGAVTPRLTGGTSVNGTTRTAAGTYTQILTAVTGNTTFAIIASGGSTLSIDNVSLREVTP